MLKKLLTNYTSNNEHLQISIIILLTFGSTGLQGTYIAYNGNKVVYINMYAPRYVKVFLHVGGVCIILTEEFNPIAFTILSNVSSHICIPLAG